MSKLNRMPWLQICLVAMLALVAWGCDDDEPAGEDDTSTGGDMTAGDVTTDTIETNGDTSTTGGDTTTTTGDTTETSADTSTGDMMMGEEVPIDWPATGDEYATTATTVSYVNTLTLPTVDPDTNEPSCCKDFGMRSKDYIDEGTDLTDNALAKLANSLGGLGLDLQGTLDEQLEAGTFALLFDHREFSGMATDDDNFVMAGLLGQFDADAGTTYAEASAGNGSFLINPSSFPNGDGVPLISFNPAMMNDGAFSAGPSDFILSLPLGIVNLEVTVTETELLGTAAIGANGVTYSDGTLSGYVLAEEIVAALNGILQSDTCACLGLTPGADIYTYNADGTIMASCLDKDEVDANCAGETVCQALAGGSVDGVPGQACTLVGTLIAAQKDIDVNGDCAIDPDNCVLDALSLGLQFTAVPATVTGVAAE